MSKQTKLCWEVGSSRLDMKLDMFLDEQICAIIDCHLWFGEHLY